MTQSAAYGGKPARRGLSLPRPIPTPALAGVGIGLVAFVLLACLSEPFRQTTVNGLVAGSFFALGAVGLTFVYGILKLVNFAHGDLLTLGAYCALLFVSVLNAPLALSILIAVVVVAALGVALEVAMWMPLRRRGAGSLQLILMSIGLAFVLRNLILLVAGGEVQKLPVNVTSSLQFFGGVHLGRTQLLVSVIAYVVIVLVGLMLRGTSLGKQMRALADNPVLTGISGINAERVIVVTWIFACGLAALAGALYAASAGGFDPNFGSILLLSLFAAVILGGIGNAYGALVGGIVLGLAEEWSTLFISGSWKIAVGFAILIVALVLRPQGLLGKAVSL